MDSQWLWYLSRGAGVACLALLTAVLVLGVVSSTGEQPRRTAVAGAVHRSLALGLLVFLVGHIATAILDGYVSIRWLATVLPFTSGYETVWIGFGTIAVDLLIAVIGTSLLRHRLSERTWRIVHQLTWPMWLIAVAHGFMLGTNTALWLRATTVLCGFVGLAAAGYWLRSATRDSVRRAEIDARGWR